MCNKFLKRITSWEEIERVNRYRSDRTIPEKYFLYSGALFICLLGLIPMPINREQQITLMLFLEIEVLIVLIIVLIALIRRAAITQWFAKRRYEQGAKKARSLFRYLDQNGGQQAVYIHLMEEGRSIRAKRRVGNFYCVPKQMINGEEQDLMLRMSDANEPRWVALAMIYNNAVKDKVYVDNHHDVPEIWSKDFDNAYEHWRDNFNGDVIRNRQLQAWVPA